MDHDQIFTLSDKFNDSQMQARPCILPPADQFRAKCSTDVKCTASLSIGYIVCAWRS